MNQRLKITIPYQDEQEEAFRYILNVCVPEKKDFHKKIQTKYSLVIFLSQRYIKNIFVHAQHCGGKRKK